MPRLNVNIIPQLKSAVRKDSSRMGMLGGLCAFDRLLVVRSMQAHAASSHGREGHQRVPDIL
jgi:hypothetical protein